jgi:hypothetical protein
VENDDEVVATRTTASNAYRPISNVGAKPFNSRF